VNTQFNRHWNIRHPYRHEVPLGKHRSRWEDNIKMGLEGTGWGDMDWNDLAQDRDQISAVVNMVMNF
jgi:hypothetical protein